MTPAASGGTEVEVLTDLAVTGKPAQFGRGVMQDVSDKLLGQFTDCLEQKVGAASAAAEPEPEAAPAAEPVAAPEQPSTNVRGLDEAPSVRSSAPPPSPPSGGDDALDLGATVLPVLLKSYWKQGLVALAVIVLVIVLIAAL